MKQLEGLPELVDVATDREQGGYQLNVVIDRDAAARVGVRIQDIENALNNAFAQRQISTLYTARNQYRVVLEIDPALQREPSHIGRIHVPSASGAQVPLSTLIRVEDGQAPLVVNHQGPFPAVTITYNVKRRRGAADGDGRHRPRGGRHDAAGEHPRRGGGRGAGLRRSRARRSR